MEAYSYPYVHLFCGLHVEAIREMDTPLLIKINEVLVAFHILQVIVYILYKHDPFNHLCPLEKYIQRL